MGESIWADSANCRPTRAADNLIALFGCERFGPRVFHSGDLRSDARVCYLYDTDTLHSLKFRLEAFCGS